MYKAEMLADSISPQGNRLTTMKITFPRFILAEMNTHRVFSRNSASSRAIPFKKMVKMVEENPFIPIAWQKDHKGMQGTEYSTNTNLNPALWLAARDEAVKYATALNQESDVTKQLCNRLLEPFMWHTVIVTATEWENFFKLRCPQYHTPVSGEGFYFRSKKDCIANHSDPDNISKLEKMTDVEWLQINESQADIHIQAIAELMWDAYNESTPKQLEAGEWHIPFGDNMDINLLKNEVVKHWDRTDKNRVLTHASRPEYVREEEIQYYQIRQKIATARCARISYQTLGDNPKIDYEADIKLHDRLLAESHMSPFEHCARVMKDEEYYRFINGESPLQESSNNYNENSFGWCRNFRGYIQYRHLVNG